MSEKEFVSDAFNQLVLVDPEPHATCATQPAVLHTTLLDWTLELGLINYLVGTSLYLEM